MDLRSMVIGRADHAHWPKGDPFFDSLTAVSTWPTPIKSGAIAQDIIQGANNELEALSFGAVQELWEQDLTKLSFVILSIWLITTLWIGFWQTRFVRFHVSDLIKVGWVLSVACMAIGMIGTVAGFVLVLG